MSAGGRGFSLVDLLEALLLLAFASFGVLPALNLALRLNISSRDFALASDLAKVRFEHVLTLPFDDAALTANETLPKTTPDRGYTISCVVTERTINPATPDPATAATRERSAPTHRGQQKEHGDSERPPQRQSRQADPPEMDEGASQEPDEQPVAPRRHYR